MENDIEISFDSLTDELNKKNRLSSISPTTQLSTSMRVTIFLALLLSSLQVYSQDDSVHVDLVFQGFSLRDDTLEVDIPVNITFKTSYRSGEILIGITKHYKLTVEIELTKSKMYDSLTVVGGFMFILKNLEKGRSNKFLFYSHLQQDQMERASGVHLDPFVHSSHSVTSMVSGETLIMPYQYKIHQSQENRPSILKPF